MAEYVVTIDTLNGGFNSKLIGAQHMVSGSVVSGSIIMSAHIGSGQIGPHIAAAGVTSAHFASGQVPGASLLPDNMYFDGWGNHNIYANAALTDATARTLSINVLDTTAGGSWKEMVRFTPDTTDPRVNFGYKVTIGITDYSETTEMLCVQSGGVNNQTLGGLTGGTLRIACDGNATEVAQLAFGVGGGRTAAPAYLAYRVNSATGDTKGDLILGTRDVTTANVAGTERLRITSAGNVFINESANAKMTTGLTINQGAADDEILTLKSSDVAHGITTITETDTYLYISKVEAGGGAYIRGFKDATGVAGDALALDAILGEAADTTKSTAAIAPLWLTARVKSGTTVADVGADGNLAVITNNGTTHFIFDADGDFWLDGSITFGATAKAINAPNLADGDYFTIGARDSDTDAIVEVARAAGAADPYFSMGGSQQNIFYNSGKFVASVGVTIGADSTNNLIDDASNGASTADLYIGNGQITVVVSDERFKTRWGNPQPGLETVLGLAYHLRSYEYIPEQKWPGTYTGFGAQTLYNYYPHLVKVPRDGNSTWSVRYDMMVPYLIKSVAEMNETDWFKTKVRESLKDSSFRDWLRTEIGAIA